MILGDWFLNKTEIIGVGDNDSSIITSINNRSDKIQFYKGKVKTLHELNSIFNILEREYFYQITYDSLTDKSTILLTKKKRKILYERIQIIYCNFNEFIFEKNIMDTGLGDMKTTVRYYYSRTGKTEEEINPMLGTWYIGCNSYFLHSNISGLTTLTLNSNKKDINTENFKNVTMLTFKTKGTFSGTFGDDNSGTYICGKYMIDIKNKIIYFNGKEIVAFNYEFIDENTLKLTVNQKMTKKILK